MPPLRSLALGLAALAWLAGAPATRAEEAAAPPAAAAPADPGALRAPVERLYATLLDVMKRADALGFEGRYRTLDPVVTGSYDVAFMAELILGRQWKELTPEQQQTWVDTFARLTVSTYADRFDGYKGESFDVGAVEPATQGTSMVRTKLVRTDGDPVELDYRMRPGEGGWRIIDVYLSGTVSELALRRSEYGALMRREGFDALLAAVREKIAAAEAGTQDDAPPR